MQPDRERKHPWLRAPRPRVIARAATALGAGMGLAFAAAAGCGQAGPESPGQGGSAAPEGLPQTCTPRAPGVETCDGLDNDCDGLVDDNLPTITCGVGACQNTVSSCVNGQAQACAPLPASAETCDGVDNDCDGVVDNGNPGAGAACSTGKQGICAAGTTVCSGGALTCSRDQGPVGETCNGADDDCDGVPDDNAGCRTSFYRSYGNGGQHFYTASYSKYLNAVNNLGYSPEGNCRVRLDVALTGVAERRVVRALPVRPIRR